MDDVVDISNVDGIGNVNNDVQRWLQPISTARTCTCILGIFVITVYAQWMLISSYKYHDDDDGPPATIAPQHVYSNFTVEVGKYGARGGESWSRDLDQFLLVSKTEQSNSIVALSNMRFPMCINSLYPTYGTRFAVAANMMYEKVDHQERDIGKTDARPTWRRFATRWRSHYNNNNNQYPDVDLLLIVDISNLLFSSETYFAALQWRDVENSFIHSILSSFEKVAKQSGWTHVCFVCPGHRSFATTTTSTFTTTNNQSQFFPDGSKSTYSYLNRLLVFQLELQYDIVVHVDHNMFVVSPSKVELNNIQSTMEYAHANLAWSPSDLSHSYMNSGVLFIRPSMTIFKDLLSLSLLCSEKSHTVPSPRSKPSMKYNMICGHSQGILMSYFSESHNINSNMISTLTSLGIHRHGVYILLPDTKYNCVVSDFLAYRSTWLTFVRDIPIDILMEECVFMHISIPDDKQSSSFCNSLLLGEGGAFLCKLWTHEITDSVDEVTW